MLISTTIASLLFALLVGANSAAAKTEEEKCVEKKIKAAGAYYQCLTKKINDSPDASPDFAECDKKYVKSFQKAERKATCFPFDEARSRELIQSQVLAATSPDSGDSDTTLIGGFQLIGIPYSSATTDGNFFMGSIKIDRFEVAGDQLKAVGALLEGGNARGTEFPVEVVESTCDLLHLKIGPATVDGSQLVHPLSVVQTPPGSELRRADFCSIEAAFEEGDLQLLADRLNEKKKIEAGVLGSCPWYKALECGALIAQCRFICMVAPPPNPACFDCIDKGDRTCRGCL